MSFPFRFYQAVILRENRKLLAQRDRLASAMVRPLLWLWVIGGGMQALAGSDYSARLLPGILGMTLLFGGMVGGLSVAFDKDAGTMRLLVTSPVHPLHVLLAKTLAAAMAALLQVTLLLSILLCTEGLYQAGLNWDLNLQGLMPWTGHLSWPEWAIFLPALGVGALCCASLGILAGVFSKSLDNYAVMMNFLIFPLFFFSGALYPIAPMPTLARWVASLNPFTYVVDLLRNSFRQGPMGAFAEFDLGLNLGLILISTGLIVGVSLWKFGQGGAAVPMRH